MQLTTILLLCLVKESCSQALLDVFTESKTEYTNLGTVKTGHIPQWVKGTLYSHTLGSIGNPAKSVPDKVDHLYDGVSKISVLKFNGNKPPTFFDRFIKSQNYKVWETQRSLKDRGASFPMLYSQPHANISYHSKFHTNLLRYAPNQQFLHIPGSILAVGESNNAMHLDVNTGENFGKPVVFRNKADDDDVVEEAWNSRYVQDEHNGEIWGVSYVLNKNQPYLRVFRVTDTLSNELYAYASLMKPDLESCSRDESLHYAQLLPYPDISILPGYIFDIALTENYLIVPTTSYILDYCYHFIYSKFKKAKYQPKLKFQMHWRPQRSGLIYIIHRKSGKIEQVKKTGAFIYDSIINAYEDNSSGVVVIDLLTQKNIDGQTKCLTVDHILNSNGYYSSMCESQPEQLVIDLSFRSAIKYTLNDNKRFMWPEINPNNRGRKYSYAYFIESWLATLNSKIVKYNIKRNEQVALEFQRGLIPDKITFLPNPIPVSEDDGLLLVNAIDAYTGKGFVTIFNAKQMAEIANISIPAKVMPSFAAQFYKRSMISSHLMISSNTRKSSLTINVLIAIFATIRFS